MKPLEILAWSLALALVFFLALALGGLECLNRYRISRTTSGQIYRGNALWKAKDGESIRTPTPGR